MRLYNTLTKRVEEFKPLRQAQGKPSNYVGVYLCGPTVYDYAHIGHMRKYVGDDVLRRVLLYLGYQTMVVMNITDVGHLVSDEDEGEDKMEKGARKHGMDVWQIAQKFTDHFFESTDLLSVQRPDVVCKATDHIAEQIELIARLEEKGFTYATSDGIYFDTKKLPDYGALSGMKLEDLIEGARVEKNPEKHTHTDFALWKFSPSASSGQGPKRQMEWDSPWGKGFPGWHIECSAMSMKYLGEQFDIHTGGIDHIPVHHTNEIAQSEAATGKKPFVGYWVHHNFLLVEGTKMSKSLGNLYTVQDVVTKGFSPVALRYLFLTSHYRSEMNFTWDNLAGAETALKRLKNILLNARNGMTLESSSPEIPASVHEYRQRFISLIEEDMRMPEVIALVWEVVKSSLPGKDVYELVMDWDRVLGLGLNVVMESTLQVASDIQELVELRQKLRTEGNYEAADTIRKELEAKGYGVEDTPSGSVVTKL